MVKHFNNYQIAKSGFGKFYDLGTDVGLTGWESVT